MRHLAQYRLRTSLLFCEVVLHFRQVIDLPSKNLAYHFKRIGLEAGPLSQWLFSALAEAGLQVICVETRHMQAVLKAQINKTDRNDARGIAQMMRAGLYRPVHVKTIRSQKLRMLLTHRKLLRHRVPLDPRTGHSSSMKTEGTLLRQCGRRRTVFGPGLVS